MKILSWDSHKIIDGSIMAVRHIALTSVLLNPRSLIDRLLRRYREKLLGFSLRLWTDALHQGPWSDLWIMGVQGLVVSFMFCWDLCFWVRLRMCLYFFLYYHTVIVTPLLLIEYCFTWLALEERTHSCPSKKSLDPCGEFTLKCTYSDQHHWFLSNSQPRNFQLIVHLEASCNINWFDQSLLHSNC